MSDPQTPELAVSAEVPVEWMQPCTIVKLRLKTGHVATAEIHAVEPPAEPQVKSPDSIPTLGGYNLEPLREQLRRLGVDDVLNLGIYLDHTSQLQIVLGGAITTNQLGWTVDYGEIELGDERFTAEDTEHRRNFTDQVNDRGSVTNIYVLGSVLSEREITGLVNNRHRSTGVGTDLAHEGFVRFPLRVTLNAQPHAALKVVPLHDGDAVHRVARGTLMHLRGGADLAIEVRADGAVVDLLRPALSGSLAHASTISGDRSNGRTRRSRTISCTRRPSTRRLERSGSTT